MPFDLILKPSCGGCGSTVELYGSSCKHLTLCVSCGKTMAQNKGKCFECGATITKLIREYNVRAYSSSEKSFFIGRFTNGLPKFSKKKKAENKWSLQKEGLQGRQVTDTLRARCKNKPWLLKDETSQCQYNGVLEGTQSATYYLLMLQGKEFVAIPASSWYNFNKVPQYNQLTLDEAEEKMAHRRKTADGYERWMMKAANNGAAAFGEIEKLDDKENGAGGERGRKKTSGDDDKANASDNEDEEEKSVRKNRLGLYTKGGGDDDEEGPRGGDLDLDDDDIEKGDDWEHEEIFTDDDEAVAIDPEEREDLGPEVPAPPEIKQDEEDEDETNEKEEGGLSKSGKELKKLLSRTSGLNESKAENDNDDEDDVEDETDPSNVPNLKQKDSLKQEAADNSTLKRASSGSASVNTPASKLAKGKRTMNADDSKPTNNATPPKKVKTENDVKPVKDEMVSTPKSGVPSKGGSSSSENTGPVTEDEIRGVLLQKTPLTTQDLVDKFRPRLKIKEVCPSNFRG
ncbi:hypothetical protein LguiB_034246 [Lonicera macranthoides]